MSEVLVRGAFVPNITQHAAARARERRAVPRRWLLLPAVCVLVGSAWLFSRYGDYKSGSLLGYNLGLAGGIGLLFILLYPLRKRTRLLNALGPTKWWFAMHMTCGVLAPFLILLHSKFHIGSVNAGVALTSMLVVAASGFVGRFIYVRIHHGLYGTRISLAELQSQVGFSSGEVRSKLSFAPRVEQWLREFEAAAVERPKNMVHGMWRFLTLGARARWVRRRCLREFARAYRLHARGQVGRRAATARSRRGQSAYRGLSCRRAARGAIQPLRAPVLLVACPACAVPVDDGVQRRRPRGRGARLLISHAAECSPPVRHAPLAPAVTDPGCSASSWRAARSRPASPWRRRWRVSSRRAR